MHSQENELETALRLAADEAAHRPDFYRALLDSTIYILGEAGRGAAGEATLEAGETVSIQHWTRADGSPVIPFFSSVAALQRSIESESHYLALPARALFEMTRGSTLVLNPRSDHGKEFFPGEIEALLSGGVNALPQRRVAQAATEVLLGQPSEYPTRMVASLKALFATRSHVRAAYLALMHDPSRDEKPHLVVGIEASGDVEQLIREAGAVASDTAPGGEPVDLFRIVRGDAGLSEHFLTAVKPFYQRGWGGRLRSLLGSGR